MKLPAHSVHRYVRLADALEFVRLGWLPLRTLEGTHHGQWAVHCCWLCLCPPRCLSAAIW